MKNLFLLKTVILVFLLGIVSNYSYGQSKEKINTLANSMGKMLTDCCSDVHRDTKVVVHEYSSSDTRIYITMTVSWYGGVSQDFYYIKGKLTCDNDGCNVSWSKIAEKGVFIPGCARNCPFRCLDY